MIRDSATGWVEATITVNGVELSFAESLAVRVAVTSFRMQVNDTETKELLGPVSQGYDNQLAHVEELMRRGK